jgi:hypothetical protein
MTFRELVDEYAEQWQGKDQFWINRKSFWVNRIGHIRLKDITTGIMWEPLKDFHLGACISRQWRQRQKHHPEQNPKRCPHRYTQV